MQFMVLPLVLLLGTLAISEGYKRYVSPEQKEKWEGTIKMHHGEAGILLTLAGIMLRSPNITSVGIGLALHDHKDAKKWFTKDKR